MVRATRLSYGVYRIHAASERLIFRENDFRNPDRMYRPYEVVLPVSGTISGEPPPPQQGRRTYGTTVHVRQNPRRASGRWWLFVPVHAFTGHTVRRTRPTATGRNPRPKIKRPIFSKRERPVHREILANIIIVTTIRPRLLYVFKRTCHRPLLLRVRNVRAGFKPKRRRH